jgi:hypothetical protein
MIHRMTLAMLLIGLGGLMSAAAEVKIEELGAPVHGVNWVRLIPGVNAAGESCLYAPMGQNAANLFVLQINPTTGAFTQHIAPGEGSNYPTAAAWGKDNRLYVGAAYSGHLFCFDPKQPGLQDLGPIDPSGASFPCRIDVAPDGALFIGAYGNASLTRYDPKTGQFTRFGRLDPVDQYAYPLVAPDGIAATLIKMTRLHVVLLDPKTGEKKTVGPTVQAGEDLDLYRGTDGQLYIAFTGGALRIRGMDAEPVAQPPKREAAPTLPNGSTFGFADAAMQEYRRLAITPPGADPREFTLDYKAEGSDIFLVHLGPDGKIYGSSLLPLHLFRYDPETSDLTDLGRCSSAGGEAYSMGNLGGKLYICSYPGARLSVYDPAQPYHFGDKEADNPRDLGRMDDFSLRPRAMLVGPLGRIWTGSYPNYGMWGGPLACYEPWSGEKKFWRDLVPDESVISLAWLRKQRLVAAGTSVEGGSGTTPKATEAALFLFDPVKEQAVWIGSPRPGTRNINALLAGPGGVVYGTAAGQGAEGAFRLLFAFDAAKREFAWSHDVLPTLRGSVLDNSLQWGKDGLIYGATHDVLFRFRPDGTGLEEVVRIKGQIGIPGPLVGKTFYFATGHRLRRFSLP